VKGKKGERGDAGKDGEDGTDAKGAGGSGGGSGGAGGSGPVLNFDFSDKFPKKGKVTVTTETSSTTTILLRGKTTHPSNSNEGEPCSAAENTCKSNEVCRKVYGKAKCIVPCDNESCGQGESKEEYQGGQ